MEIGNYKNRISTYEGKQTLYGKCRLGLGGVFRSGKVEGWGTLQGHGVLIRSNKVVTINDGGWSTFVR